MPVYVPPSPVMGTSSGRADSGKTNICTENSVLAAGVELQPVATRGSGQVAAVPREVSLVMNAPRNSLIGHWFEPRRVRPAR